MRYRELLRNIWKAEVLTLSNPRDSLEARKELARFESRIPLGEVRFTPVISMRRRYVYFPISKAANSSIKYILKMQDAESCNLKITDVHQRLHVPLLAPFQVGDKYYVNEILRGDYFRFTFVRNPFTRLLSCYLDRIIGHKSSRARRQFNRVLGTTWQAEIPFSTFIEAICKQPSKKMNDHWRDQYTSLQCGDIELSLVGKVERLQQDLDVVSHHVCFDGEPPLSSDVNKSPQKTSAAERVNQYYDERLADMVRERFEKDFTVYGYSMELGRAGEP